MIFNESGVVFVGNSSTQVLSTGYAEGNNTMVVDGGTWDTSNQSQVWSSYGVNDGTYPWTGAFDGVTNSTYNTNEATSAQNTNVVEWAYTGSEELSFTKIEVWANRDDGVASGTLLINNVDVSSQLTANTYGWYELTGVTGPLTSIKMTGYSNGLMRLGAVKLDGKILVDATFEYDFSGNTSGVPNSTYPYSNLFNGNLTSNAVPGPGATAGKWSYTTDLSSFPIECNTFEVYIGSPTQSSAAAFVSLNGVEQAVNGASVGWKSLTIAAPLTLTSFAITREAVADANNGAYFSAVRINGKLLLDNGASNLGDTKVTLQTYGGQGTVDTVDTSTNSIVITPTGNSLNRWIGTNKAGTIFYAGSPTKPAISQKAYLKFTGAGLVESVSAAPVAPQAMESRNPTSYFSSNV